MLGCGFGVNDRQPKFGYSLLPKANTAINVVKSSPHNEVFRMLTSSKGSHSVCNIGNNKNASRKHIIPQEGTSNTM